MADGLPIDPEQKCGCYWCRRIFLAKEITDWVEEEGMALCPHCGMDSVVLETIDMSLTPERLNSLYERTFG
jgi:hypothetical protein